MENEGRLAGWSGIVFSILSVVVVVFSPELPPPLGSTPQVIAEYFTKHRFGFLLGNYLGVAAFFPGFIQLVVFSSRIKRREKPEGWFATLVLASGICAYAVGAVVLILLQAIPFLVGPQPESVGALVAVATLGNICFALFFLLSVPYFASAGWALRATGAGPGWFTSLSYAISILFVVTSLGAIWSSPDWLAAGGMASNVSFMAFFAWTFVLAVLQLKRRI